MTQKIHHYIGGRFVESSSKQTFTSINPATEETLAEVSAGDAQDVDAAVYAAKNAAKEFSRWTLSQRAKLVRRIGDLILENKEDLARLETQDCGKPISETLTGDILRSARNFHFYADFAEHEAAQTYIGEDRSTHTTFREPLGVVGLITPWNLPLYLETWKLAPALMMGNGVVLKPAELTPMSAHALCKLVERAGAPAGLFNVVQGFGANSAGEALVAHPDVSAISFTGETTTGQAIMKGAAQTLKKVSFELGGKGASVIFADADLTTAAATSCRAAFRNQGQICLAGSRVIVHESVAKEFVALMREAAQQIVVGDPLDPKTTMGALISDDHRSKVMSYIDYAKREGAGKVTCGGQVPSHCKKGYFLEPTFIEGVAQNSKLIQEEIFGPVVTIQTFKTQDEALELLNGTPYGLSCSVWTKDNAQAQFMAAGARIGMVWINGWFMRDLHTAFGGMKKSGVGREGGRYSLDFFSEQKTVTYASTF